jgi:hypothetical protein
LLIVAAATFPRDPRARPVVTVDVGEWSRLVEAGQRLRNELERDWAEAGEWPASSDSRLAFGEFGEALDAAVKSGGVRS